MSDAPPTPPARSAPTGGLAPVDALRSLPYPLMLATLARLERDLGAEAVASLRYAWPFWARPNQRLPDPSDPWATLVITGDYGTGKSLMGQQLFVREILEGRSTYPRIICATRQAITGVVEGASGIRRWLALGVQIEWLPSGGHAGHLTLNGIRVRCCSADAPGQMIGEGSDLDLRDDVAKWVASSGADAAKLAWDAARKSCREGAGRAIVPTTPDGAEFIRRLAKGEGRRVTTIDLGRVEDNRGNLAPNYLHAAQDMREEGVWNLEGNASPFAPINLVEKRLEVCPALVELAIAIDPARSAGAKSCEVGIAGGGRDARSTVHVRHDRSAVLDGGRDGWPKVAWDLAEEMQAEHPDVPWHFVLESNLGTTGPADLLRAEERARHLRRGEREITICEIRPMRAGKDKCERAKLPALLTQHGQVRFAPKLKPEEAGHVAEGQLKNLTAAGHDTDRADAIVHLIRDLAGLSDEKEITRVATEEEQQREQEAQCLMAAQMNAAARHRGQPPQEPGVMKIEGVPAGDARSPGQPRPAGRPQTWRTRSVL